MKLKYLLSLLLMFNFYITFGQNSYDAFNKLFRVFSAYDTVHMVTNEDTLLFSLNEIEESNIVGTKKILIAKSKTIHNFLSPEIIIKKYGGLIKSLGGIKLRHINKFTAMYEIVLQDTQHVFFIEAYNEGRAYSLTLINTKIYKLNPKKLYEQISDEGVASLYINFGFNKSHIPEEAIDLIESIVQFMNHWKDIKLSIEGHTDNIGTAEQNKKLSLNRANTVMLTLITNGIDPKRLSAKGWGEENPITSNNTKEGQKQNRRVELVRIVK